MTVQRVGSIPQADPLALPAPAWLLWALLLAMFVLHLLAMNVTLGGSIIAAVARFRSRRDDRRHDRTLARVAAAAMPVSIAATVTLGVAALLFLQVLYGRLFFVSAVLIGWLWLAVIPMLILAYGLAYRVAFRDAAERGNGQLAGWIIVAVLISIAVVYVNNMSLVIRPDRFVPVFTGDTRTLHLNLEDPTLVPRFLHMLLGAVAVAGIATAHFGLWTQRHDPDFGAWVVRLGTLWFVSATSASVVAGIWWLAALPKETVLRFMGENVGAALALAGGVILGLASLVAMAIAISARRRTGIIRAASGTLLLALLLMILTRDQIRTAALASAGYSPTTWIEPQWGLVGLFGLLLLVAITLIAGMAAAVVRGAGRAEAAGAAKATQAK